MVSQKELPHLVWALHVSAVSTGLSMTDGESQTVRYSRQAGILQIVLKFRMNALAFGEFVMQRKPATATHNPNTVSSHSVWSHSVRALNADEWARNKRQELAKDELNQSRPVLRH